ncbi:hypothetical protein DL93DRAFT_1414879 [Clavulina sp. PMI_390]|nr:hypothetical protein DL93DRAFT_1414879 [Clavulina sp. PMI_390]
MSDAMARHTFKPSKPAGNLAEDLLQSRPVSNGQPTQLIDGSTALILREETGTKVDRASVHNSLQPFTSLPFEIFSLICFIASPRSDDSIRRRKARPDTQERELVETMGPSRSFVSLNLACKRARQVAAASSRCWKDIYVIIEGSKIITPSHALEDRLCRSKVCYIDLFFYDRRGRGTHVTSAKKLYNGEILGVLSPHIHRCQHIAFYTPYARANQSPTHMIRILQDFSWSYPSLQKITILQSVYTALNPSYLRQFWPDNSKNNVDCIELLWPRGIQYGVSLSNLFTPPGVKHLRLHNGFEYSAVLDFLQQSPQLEHLDWEFGPEAARLGLEPETEAHLVTIAPKLRSLRLRFQALHPGSFGLVAPECEELSMHELDLLWSRYLAVPCREYWNSLTLPSLKRLSIQRSPSHLVMDNPSQPKGIALSEAMMDFFDRHSELGELFIFEKEGCFDLTWRWLFVYLIGQRQRVFERDTSGDNFNTSTGHCSDATQKFPLPKLRALWFQAGAFQWSGKLGDSFISSIRNVLLARPDILITLCTRPTTSSKDGEDNLSPPPLRPELEALGIKFGIKGGLEVTGGLKIVPWSAMPKWPEAWGFSRSHEN